MNYPNLLARGLLLLYCIFLLLFGFEEGVLEQGYIHAVPAVAMLGLMVVFKNKPALSSLVFLFTFLFSIWFFKTYQDIVSFLIISAPLIVVSILFFMGKKSTSPKL